jgi:NAD(P)H-hydrate repair Nnr-like enzyme with NAD(P)H-hydrate epimerase domain
MLGTKKWKRTKLCQTPNRKKQTIPKIGSRNYKISINDHFWGGFAVDAVFGDGFSGSMEGPKRVKNR